MYFISIWEAGDVLLARRLYKNQVLMQMVREVGNMLTSNFNLFYGGAEEDRTPDLKLAKLPLSQAELQPHLLVGWIGSHSDTFKRKHTMSLYSLALDLASLTSFQDGFLRGNL